MSRRLTPRHENAPPTLPSPSRGEGKGGGGFSYFLSRAIKQNKAILFLGAGFSTGAANCFSNPIPSGNDLALLLWEFLGYSDTFDGTDLPTLYEAALKSHKGLAALRVLLEEQLLAQSIPSWYGVIRKIFWNKIYTTNVDNVVEQVYQSQTDEPNLETIVAPRQDYKERDQFMSSIQFIKLSGTLPGPPNELTFSTRQYARRSSEHDTWYDHFVRDYSTHVTLLIGTNLAEPLFWQYVEARDKRFQETSEHRPRSFLVCPRISPPKKDIISGLNIVGVEATAQQFLEWLEETLQPFQSRYEVLQTVAPSLAQVLQADVQPLSGSQRRRIERFYACFDPVVIPTPNASHRKLYLLGASPDWQDLAHEFDAPRSISQAIHEAVRTEYSRTDLITCFAILGSAGCGKSTILKRLALSLVAEGHPVFFCTSENLPRNQDLVGALEFFLKRAILVFDNADLAFGWFAGSLAELARLERPPLIIIASRTNRYDRRSSVIENQIQVRPYHVPQLERAEIDSLIAILERNNLLGRLRGMTTNQRRAEFEQRAQKQILVAMREATQGPGFNEIIKGEFNELAPQEAKILYLCAALPTAAGFRLSKQQLLGCAEEPPSIALDLITRTLRDIVIPTSEQPDLLHVRHAVIAEYVLNAVAPRGLLREAYVRLLKVLANDLGSDRASRAFRLYRRIVNHDGIYRRFLNNLVEARAIFESIQDWFSSDPHFWLQFGSLELEYGELAFASNYIDQAESLAPSDSFILTAKAHLNLRKAICSEGSADAAELWRQGYAALVDQIRQRGATEVHPFHILGSQTITYVKRCLNSFDEKKQLMEGSIKLVEAGVRAHPRSELGRLLDDMKRTYLELAIPG